MPKWCFVIEIGRSVDPSSGSLNNMGEERQVSLEPDDQVVKVGEGWVDLEPVLLSSCQRVAKWVNILLGTIFI